MTGMIVAPQPIAVEAGADVLRRGGNAFDAALTAAAVQFVVDPHSCGIGGYLVMTSCGPNGAAQPVIDAPALAGGWVTPTMWQEAVIGPNPEGWGYFLKDKVNDVGYASVCTPGMVRGMEAIHGRYCSLSWADIFQPAIDLAENGWVVGAFLADRWKAPVSFYESANAYEKVCSNAAASAIYLHEDGRPYEMHETLRNPDYAATMRRIAERGADDFYSGELAAEISADLNANGAWVNADDLSSYASRVVEPVRVTYRDYTVVTNPPPHGGPTLAATLKILEGYDLKALGHNSAEYIRLVSRAMQAAFCDRNHHLGDPNFRDVPLDWMVSKERAAEWRAKIDSGERIDVTGRQHDTPDTTQVTVVDSAGNCVSLTHSLGSSSGAVTPGLGFMYNNSMVNFDPVPGGPNEITPGKGRTTGMTPTLVLHDGKPVLVLGAPGATRIVTSVLQVILNRLDFGMPILDAVYAPRFDCQGDVIKCQARIPESTCAEVRRHQPIERIPQSHGGLALVHAISLDPVTGDVAGAADTGADGMALAVP